MALNLILKVTNGCNFGCRYPCYYYNRVKRDDAIMDLNTLKVLYTEAAKIKGVPKINTIWHGGEPLLAGLDWFKQAVEIQKGVYADSGKELENSVQTNGTLITKEWAEFFGENSFQVGISIDGPTHDMFRLTVDGEPTLNKVLESFEIMRKYGCGAGGLVVITKENVGRANELLDFMLAHDINSFDILPNMEYGRDGEPLKHSITGTDFGQFVVDLYKAWLNADRDDVKIRTIEQIVGGLLGTTPDLCSFCPGCGGVLCLDTGGQVYPCDEFVGSKDLFLGNILDSSLTEMLKSKIYRDFTKMSLKMSPACYGCEFEKICGGNCSKYRMNLNMQSTCNGRKKIFTAVRESLIEYSYL